MSQPSTHSGTARKGVLYCPNCEHESLYDGDWRLQPRGDRIAYVCPECKTVLTTRPRTDDAPAVPSQRSARAAEPFTRLWRVPIKAGFDAGATVIEKLRPDRSTPAD